MSCLVGQVGVLVALFAAAASESEPELPPDQQVKALAKEYQDSLNSFEKAFGEIKSEAKREEFFRKNYPRPERLYARFMALAEKHSGDAAAVDALIWVVNHCSNEPSDEATQRKALAMLARDHVGSDKLPSVFERADEEFLRAALEKSPHHEVRGRACFAMVEKRLWRVRSVDRWRRDNPDWQQRNWLRQTAFAYLVNTDVDEVTKEAEKLLEQVARDYANVAVADRRNGKTLGDLAKGHLHEIRHLAVGQKAPELVSVDLQGKPVGLAELKGNVVVLDVWATWCGPCRAMIPHLRELVKRLKGKRFTLVSISVDEKSETVAGFVKKEPMPWCHWFNGSQGSIIRDLNVWSYPTIYVLDGKGVIRHKDVRGKLLDKAVDDLLKEAEGQ